jgi:GH25 family lysozyme M1 (1,4-beta-N-acetylmuramidase)
MVIHEPVAGVSRASGSCVIVLYAGSSCARYCDKTRHQNRHQNHAAQATELCYHFSVVIPERTAGRCPSWASQ